MNDPIQSLGGTSAICRRMASLTLALAIVFVLTVLATASAEAQNFEFSRLLYSFSSTPDAAGPVVSKLVMDTLGNLYGTTSAGGAFGAGTIYELDSSGKETVLYSFTGTGGDGANPHAGVVLDALGNLYGSTYYGGDLACGASLGCGTVFKLDTTGHETVLYSFTGGPGDGANPSGDLVLDVQGNLYGTTYAGGVNTVGTVFKLTASGVETVLHGFICCSEGEGPQGLVMDAAGNLYGTTRFGGVESGHKDVCGDFGCGTLYKLSQGGVLTVLHDFTFTTGSDGAAPNPELVMDAQGNIYGTTFFGGYTQNSRVNGGGMAFEIDPHGNETVLYQFCPPPDPVSCPNGVWPAAGLFRDSAGNLYGTTTFGHGGNGTVFLLDTTRSYSVLYAFKQASGGAYMPTTSVVLDPQGNLYLVTAKGGTNRSGTVFALLTPAAETSTSITSAPNPSTYGQPVTFTAIVKTSTGMPNDGEAITFKHRTTVLGTGILSGGSASFTISTLPVLATTVTAVYGGDTHHAGSSGAVKQVVKNAQ